MYRYGQTEVHTCFFYLKKPSVSGCSYQENALCRWLLYTGYSVVSNVFSQCSWLLSTVLPLAAVSI